MKLNYEKLIYDNYNTNNNNHNNNKIKLFIHWEKKPSNLQTNLCSIVIEKMRIAIIGGGISGLSAAYYIKKFALPVSEVF